MIKIYKFRQLKSCEDFCRIKDIINTREFWCSEFSDLNDPMEGVYIAKDKDKAEQIYDQKQKYKICSFSGQKGFDNPAIWGYYAGGFHGVAIEVEIAQNKVRQVQYACDMIESNDVVDILTSKLDCWKHEDEYRYLNNVGGNNSIKIGKINKVYFGNPYGGLTNTDDIQGDNKNLQQYKERAKELKTLLNQEGIKYDDVEVECKKVIIKKIN